MSVRVLTAVFDRSSLKGSSFTLMLALADIAGDDGTVVYGKTSHEDLAAKSRLTVPTYRRAMKGAEESGELEVERRPGRPNGYRITLLDPAHLLSRPPASDPAHSEQTSDAQLSTHPAHPDEQGSAHSGEQRIRTYVSSRLTPPSEVRADLVLISPTTKPPNETHRVVAAYAEGRTVVGLPAHPRRTGQMAKEASSLIESYPLDALIAAAHRIGRSNANPSVLADVAGDIQLGGKPSPFRETPDDKLARRIAEMDAYMEEA